MSPDNKLSGDNWRSWWNQVTGDDSKSQIEDICKALTLTKVKVLLGNIKNNYLYFDRATLYLTSCKVQINDLMDIYSYTNDDEIHLLILQLLNIQVSLPNSNEKMISFYKTVVKETKDEKILSEAVQGLAKLKQVDEILLVYNSRENDNSRVEILRVVNSVLSENNPDILALNKAAINSKNRSLAAVAFRGIVNSSTNDKWTNWQWSDDILNILKDAANKDLYKLSGLDYTELLAIANKYPDSKFTKACIEYRSFTEGTYFGMSGGSKSELRQPFDPSREIKFWPDFLRKYPDHPGSDDAMYRLARAYEMKGDYETAILWYYKSSKAPDGSMSDLSKGRILLLVDLLLSSDSITKFLEKIPKHPLTPYLLYSKAIHLFRENKLQLAHKDLTEFIGKYQDTKLSKISSRYTDDNQLLTKDFWSKLEQQNNHIKKLIVVQDKSRNDEALYEEAAYWFNNDFLAYNHLWQGASEDQFSSSLPDKWEGAETSIRKSITYEFYKAAKENYAKQNRYLKSIGLFEEMLKTYPESKIAAEAKYSIGLNYYYLELKGYSIQIDQKPGYWADLAISNYKELVTQFPSSSLADDAMLVSASLSSKEDAVKILKEQLARYPKGDRYKEAKFLSEALNGINGKLENSSKPSIEVGINLVNVQSKNGVVIQDIISNSPAKKAGLYKDDIILQVDNQSVVTVDDVKNIIIKHKVGENIKFSIQRNGQNQVINVVASLGSP